MHSGIYKTYLVQWCCIDLWSIGVGGYIGLRYMCILLHMKPIWYKGVAYIYSQLEGVGSVCLGYMCILL